MKLELTIDEINIVLTSLGRQPYDAVADTIQKVRAQVQPQYEAHMAAEAKKLMPENEDQKAAA